MDWAELEWIGLEMSFTSRLNSTTKDMSKCRSLSQEALRQALRKKSSEAAFFGIELRPSGILMLFLYKSLPPNVYKILQVSVEERCV